MQGLSAKKTGIAIKLIRFYKQFGLSTRQLMFVIGSVIFMAASSFSINQYIEYQYKVALQDKLETLLTGITESTQLWAQDQRMLVESLATDEHIITLTRALLSAPRHQKGLLAAPAQDQLRIEIRSYLDSKLYEGYFIIAPDNISLASSRDANVGTPNLLIRYPDILSRLFSGETLLTPIQHSDVAIFKERGAAASNNETMFVAAPVKDKDGSVIALLTLRINPYRSLFPIMERARLAETGESYAFDYEGRLLSKSRYDDELVRIGLLKPGESSASNLFLRDPGYELSPADAELSATEKLPLTKMAINAISGQEGIDLDGYRDFRGVPVVGAWHWDKQLEFGFAFEQTVTEAYWLLNFVRLTIFVIAAMAVSILIALVVVLASGRRKIADVQKRLESVINTASDGVVVIKETGIIDMVNPAMEQIFGYSMDSLKGKNISELMPEPFRHQHDAFLSNHNETGGKRIIASLRELEAQRANGEVFPIELTVNRLQLDSGIYFSGILRDISARKQAEFELEQERDFTRDVLDGLYVHIMVVDDNGDVLLTNKAWDEFEEKHNSSRRVPGEAGAAPTLVRHISVEGSGEPNYSISELLGKLNENTSTFIETYSCHTLHKTYWFKMRAHRFMQHGYPIVVISQTDITPLIESEQKLRVTSMAAESTNSAVMVTDTKGIIQWVNNGFTSLSGFGFDEAIGQYPPDLLRKPDTDLAHRQRVDKAVKEGVRIDGEVLNYHKNGTPYWVRFEVSPVYDKQKNLVQMVVIEHDITAEKQLLEDLRREREATEQANLMLNISQQALNRTGIGEFWTDIRDIRIFRVNDQVCELLGYSKAEIIGRSATSFEKNFSDEIYIEREQEIQDKGWGRFETTVVTKQGKDVPVELIVVSIPDSSIGDPIAIAFCIDITERKKNEQALIQAKEEAQEANRAKSTFLATMSHEIRTPLFGVVGTVEMLENTKLDSSQQELVNTAKNSSVLLQGIIDDILDFSKIEAGRLDLEQIPVLLEPLLETLADNLNHIAVKKNVELFIYCDPWLPEVQGDPVRLRQIIYNLAGNAIKFCSKLTDKQGRVIISVFQQGQDNDHANICLRVSDNGIGMSKEVQKRLFQPFVQAEEQTTRHFGGTGLGLVITERLTALMEGTIKLESAEGEGATFNIYLPLKTTGNQAETDESVLQGLKVVIVQSNDDSLFMVEKYLQHAKAEVFTTTTDKAVALCAKLSDGITELVVLIDAQGNRRVIEPLLNTLRSFIKNDLLRFVVLERGQRRYVRNFDEDGLSMDLNVLRRSSLVNVVAAAVGRESPIQDNNTIIEMLSDTPLDVEQARDEGRLILLADDNETNRMLITQQLQLMGYAAEVARDGLEALEMWRKGSYNMLLTDCHMPEMDGYQLAEMIRKEEVEGEHIPIIAITADAMKGTAQKCYTAGMDDYMTKPLQLAEIKVMLDKWFQHKTENTEGTENKQQKQNISSAEENEIIDPRILSDLLGSQDREMLTGFYLNFLETSAPTVAQIKEAFSQENLVELSRLAHKLKSSASAVGAASLAECCQVLEAAGKKGNVKAVNEQIDQFFELFNRVTHWIKEYEKS